MNRTTGVSQHNPLWSQVQHSQAQDQARNRARQSFGIPSNRSFRARSGSDRSDSADEVENMLLQDRQPTRRVSNQGGWAHPSYRAQSVQQHGKFFGGLHDVSNSRAFPYFPATASSTTKRAGKFRPAGLPR